MAEIILQLKGKELRRVPITRRRMRIGRNAFNEIVLDNIAVSRHHATVVYQAPNFLVIDEGSQNGLFVNGAQEDTCNLSDGDIIQVGKFELHFNEAGGPSPNALNTDADVPDPVRDPEETKTLSADEVQRYIAASSGATNRVSNVSEQASQPQQTTTESGVPYRNLAIGLGSTVLVLLGIIAYFLANN